MAKTKISRINSQASNGLIWMASKSVDTSKNLAGWQAKAFANVNEAKSFYYTDNELACFDTHCEKVEWAVINDSDNRATQLKFTAEFAAGAIPGKDKDWHDALDLLESELQAHADSVWGDSTVASMCSVADSDDHLF